MHVLLILFSPSSNLQKQADDKADDDGLNALEEGTASPVEPMTLLKMEEEKVQKLSQGE